ncbi:MAG: twin-arginine translocase TatA/TatE family subunit, partial [Planctomycetota bacterium]|nr:twin-arginine translocase TatA/TatE family subunit [Planctomycetota bacterium]
VVGRRFGKGTSVPQRKFFGKRLPGIARSLGQALTEFKSGLTGSVEADGTAGSETETHKKRV